MTLTVLFDLDDTLLDNDIQPFIQRYFEMLADSMAELIAPAQFQWAMQQAVYAMLHKQLPAGTLEDTFDQVFYPALGVSKQDLKNLIDDFYHTKFPLLKELTRPRETAIRLVECAFERNWQVVIATNPLFPRTAIEQRLEWAGLPISRFPFALVTTYENSHFCKPHPAYFAEILAVLRWPQTPIVMVGNSIEDDILPAEQLGLPTYHVFQEGSPPKFGSRNSLSKSGSLDEVLDWLDTIAQAESVPAYESVAAILATLQSTPAALHTFSSLLPEHQWNQRPEPKEWCFTEILCHLRDVDREVNLERIQTILTQNRPFLPAAMTDGWVEQRNCILENGRSALEGFIEARSEIISKLLNLNERDWQKPARHAIFGPTTLKELVGFVATHDRIHINQAWQTIQTIRAE
ncbi:MAG: DinB family protein [Chloroflexota bacterium]